MTKPTRVLKILLCTTLLLAACSKKSEEGTEPTATVTTPATTPAAATELASDKQPDPCTLLTTDQAKEILGKPVKEGARGDIQGLRDCVWQGGATLEMVTIDVRHASSFAAAKALAGKTPEDVPGIGDQAVYGTVTVMKNVVFTKGTVYVHLSVMGAKDDEAKARLLAAAKSIASRI